MEEGKYRKQYYFENEDVARELIYYDAISDDIKWKKREPWVFAHLPNFCHAELGPRGLVIGNPDHKEAIDDIFESNADLFNSEYPGKQPTWHKNFGTGRRIDTFHIRFDRNNTMQDSFIAVALNIPVQKVREIAWRKHKKSAGFKPNLTAVRGKKKKATSAVKSEAWHIASAKAEAFRKRHLTTFFNGKDDDRSALNSFLKQTALQHYLQGRTEEQIFDAVKTYLGGTRDNRPMRTDNS